ncbi:uncharacterized protein PgNI_08550 [Pyricularia grisea]|uniref:Uncharacterized protein n=1 Tax=Pyricularia grisea TaxID=148305 RepID=A0A6P8AUU6_PYRGI|nr:uncharacterized protein PgNI_08550 [Pyricularia grisea]TLD05975.1 hypothetical protein PgNI_08550 [Pyricularia grisea]
MGLPPVAVGWLVCFRMNSLVKHLESFKSTLNPQCPGLQKRCLVSVIIGLVQAKSELLQAARGGAVLNPFQPLAVVAGPVLPKVFQDLGQRRRGHGYAKKVVGGRNYRVVSPRLAAEIPALAVADALILDSVGEHALRGDAEDESTEGGIAAGLGLLPHGFHDLVNLLHGLENLGQAAVDLFAALLGGSGSGDFAGIKSLHNTRDKRA